MMKHDGSGRCVTLQLMEAGVTEDCDNDELTMPLPSGDGQINPWPVIRQAVHAYARDPSEENALAVEISMRHLRQQRDFAQ